MDINNILEKHAAWLAGDRKSGKRADLRYADLKYADLRYADLKYVDLGHADLRYADLGHADLRYADLKYADLRYADLKYVDLGHADLRYAGLGHANLRYAGLWGCIGNMVHIRSVFCDQYPVTYTADVMQIACQRHPIDDWWEFNDKRILEMDGKRALKWWRIWKPILKQIIEAAPAEATGYQGARK